MRSSVSIRTQLVVLMLAVTIPLTAGAAYIVWSEIQLSRRLADRTALGSAEATALSVGQFLADARQTLDGISDRPPVQGMSPEQCGPFLNAANQALTQFVNFVLVRQDGTLVCSALTPPPELPGGPDPEWFRQPEPGERFSVGEPREGPISGVPMIALRVPVEGPDGTTVGYLAASVALERFRRFLVSEDMPANGRVVLAHTDGTAIVSAGVSEIAPGELPEIEDPRGGVIRAPDSQGLDRVWGYRSVPGLEWIAYATMPAGWANSDRRTEIVVTTAVVLLIILVSAILVVGLYRRVTGALAGLVRGVESAAEGHDTSIPTRGPPEVKVVAQAFNRTLAERNRAEEELRRQSSRYQSILQNASLGIYVSTERGQIVEANPAMAEMLGYDSPEELLQVPMKQLYRDPDARDDLVEEALHGRGLSTVDVEWVRQDGAPLYARLHVNTLVDPDGETTFEVVAEDLTERRALEEQLRQSQKLEALGRLAGGVAHDFNNRLTVIQGQVGIMLADLPEGDPLHENAEAILESAVKASNLTAQLLAFGRKQVTRPRPLDLNQVVERMGRVLPKLIGEDIVLETRLSPENPTVFEDPGHVEQILLNLCTNARDAMPKGGTLTISTDRRDSRPEDRVHDRDPRDYGVLAVADTGVGMDEDIVGRIFEPFFTTKPEGKGSGLGLSTVYGLVTQSGGHVDVDSEPGEGTTFEVWLPLSDRAPWSTESDGAAEEIGPPRPITVLVVEDEEGVRRIVVRTLQRAGYEVLEARDGRTALEIVGEHDGSADVLVTDVVMPGMRGGELAERLSSRQPELLVLFMSGYTDEAPGTLVGTNPRRDFMPKPFTPDELLRRLKALVDEAPQAS